MVNNASGSAVATFVEMDKHGRRAWCIVANQSVIPLSGFDPSVYNKFQYIEKTITIDTENPSSCVTEN
jgi:hypothetical protein